MRLYSVVGEKRIRVMGAEKVEMWRHLQGVRQQGGLEREVNMLCSQSSLLSPTHLCLCKPPKRHIPGALLGHSHLPFCSQVPCWILKDYMMKKCALQITYRSMQFLTFPCFSSEPENPEVFFQFWTRKLYSKHQIWLQFMSKIIFFLQKIPLCTFEKLQNFQTFLFTC